MKRILYIILFLFLCVLFLSAMFACMDYLNTHKSTSIILKALVFLGLAFSLIFSAVCGAAVFINIFLSFEINDNTDSLNLNTNKIIEGLGAEHSAGNLMIPNYGYGSYGGGSYNSSSKDDSYKPHKQKEEPKSEIPDIVNPSKPLYWAVFGNQ